MKRNNRAILWFRQDLRLHDNEALADAMSQAQLIYPTFVFDSRVLDGQTRYGFPKTGPHRLQFLFESVANLGDNLRKLGADLILRTGKPEEEIFNLANAMKVDWVYCNRERTAEEVKVQDALEQKLWTIGVELRYARGKMLFYTQDLPFPVTHTPDTFTQFRKEVEKYVPVREPLDTPDMVPFVHPDIDLGSMPVLEDFGHVPAKSNHLPAARFYEGGESAGLRRLDYYFGAKNLAHTYKETRNEMLGTDYSTRFSAWLSMGCISPKMVYQRLKNYEAQYGENESTYWILFELMWRDYFRLVGKKYNNKIFQKSGIRGIYPKNGFEDKDLFAKWAKGQTSVPIVDANMTELNQTGFMSNRGRQITASYLVNDLGLNWQMGASYFESLLIDYDPCSNWGNWMYLAGVGNDPKEDRYFNPVTQAKRYDPQGEYVKHWLPHLSSLTPDQIHTSGVPSPAH